MLDTGPKASTSCTAAAPESAKRSIIGVTKAPSGASPREPSACTTSGESTLPITSSPPASTSLPT